MSSRLICQLTCLLILPTLATPSWATPALTPIPAAAKMSPSLLQSIRAHRAVQQRPLSGIALLAQVRSEPGGEFDALVERLSNHGALFTEDRKGEWLRSAGWYALTVSTRDALLALEQEAAVVALALGAPRGVAPSWPVDGTYVEVLRRAKIDTVQARRDAMGHRTLGTGVVLCDIDDGIDPFHPMFFRADGGNYQWFDVDGDGAITPGVDRIDFDRDGEPDGVLRLLEAGFTTYGDPTATEVDGAFTPGRDYLYYDYDDNGVRDVGPPAYNDQSPSLGEPLFIADDVDGDGALSVHERLIGLKTSKIKAVWTPTRSYVRGTDLSDHPASLVGPHGTGVSGVLVGGTPGHSHLLGVAPDADLVMISRANAPLGPSMLAALEFAKGMGASLFLHEYGNHFAEFGDGSSAWESVLDDQSAAGFAQVTATHNFAGLGGHGAQTIQPGASQEIGIESLGFPGSGQLMFLTLRWPDASPGDLQDLGAVVQIADGTSIPLEATEGYFGQWYVAVTTGVSNRDTGMVTLMLGRLNAELTEFLPIGNEQMLLQLTNGASEAIAWELHVSDESGYSYAMRLQGPTTSVGTIAHPSTADSAISVGASVGNVQDGGETQSGLRSYSGRGPRIDGAQGVDIVAPTDHFSTLYHASLGQGGSHYGHFGGTSGALPVVTAALALLRQHEPTLTPEEMRARLTSSAGSDGETGAVPNNEWGSGRLRVHELIFGESPAVNGGPTARIATTEAYGGYEATLSAQESSDPDDETSSLTYRWDFDYDGVWDVEQVGDATVKHTFGQATGTSVEVVVKLAVEDPDGFSDELLTVVTVNAGAPPEPQPEPAPDTVAEATPEAGGDVGGDLGGTDLSNGAENGSDAASGGASDDEAAAGCECGASSGPKFPLESLLVGLGVLMALFGRRRLLVG